MSILRIMRLGIRAAEWATPHIKEWHERKHLNRNEGARHFQARNYTEAERHLTAALEENHSANHKVEILAQLATSQVRLNKLGAAAVNARAAADLAGTSGNREAQWQAVDSLVSIQMAQGDLKSAVESLYMMEQSESRQVPPDFERVVKSARQRGKFLLQMGHKDEAMRALESSVQAAEKHWGGAHVELAHGLSELGSLYSRMGEHQKALPYLERAMGIYRNNSGFDSVEASNGLQSLAVALEEAGEVDRAIAEWERYLSAQERMVGASRTDMAQGQVRLAALYIQDGRSSAARELLMLAIGILSRTPGMPLKDALEIMAVAEDQSGRPLEAEQFRKKAALVVIPEQAPAVS